jgi:protoporphyrinogen oxidase
MKVYDAIIIGAGLSGLSSAYFLSKNGYSVLVIEKEKEIGGLCGSYKIDGYYIEKFYHHAFPFDNTVKELLKELKIDDLLEWRNASIGFYIDKKVYKLDTVLDILNYPLGLIDKIKLGSIILKIKMERDFFDLDNVPAKKWLIKNGGNKLYRNFFLPLLRGKYGDMIDETSAAWFLERIKLRSSRSLKGEKLGYIKYGFKALIDKLMKRIIENDGKIITNRNVIGVKSKNKNNLTVSFSSKNIEAKYVISTIPPQKLLKICDFPENYIQKLQRIKYQGTICVLFGLKKRLQDVYWLNIKSSNLPFAGVIEHTNFYNIQEYKDRLVYVTSYIQNEYDSIWNKSDGNIVKSFIDGLKKMFPSFNEKNINWWKIQKNKYTAPIYSMGYLGNMPGFKTPIKGLYLSGMSLTFDRTMDRSLKIGKECAFEIINSSEEN